MSTTLSQGATTVTLPADLLWSDEFSWMPVKQSTERSITGSLVIDSQAAVGGRQISLSGSESAAWMPRTTVEVLYGWVAQAGLQMTLTLRGVARTVIFDHERGALDVRPVVEYADPQGDDWYSVSLRFIEV